MMLRQPIFASKNAKVRRFIHNQNIPQIPLSELEKQRYQIENWMIEPAYFENDIIWSELNYDQAKGQVVNIFSFLGLFIVSLVVITPMSLYSVVDPVARRISTDIDTVSSQSSSALRNAASPLSLALCNSWLIPCLVDWVASMTYNDSKSQLQIKIFHMNLLFMTLNMILLPLTGLISIQDFIDYSISNELNFVNDLGLRMGQMAAFFTIYLIQVTFLFNLGQVLSTSHLISSLLWDRFIKFLKGIQFKDEYPFDLGYWLSLSSTICLMSLVFSVTMPILTGVGFCFCASRYFIEKYNVLFVYQKDFDS